MNEFEMFQRLMHLRPDPEHCGINDECIIPKRSRLDVERHTIWRGLTAFYIRNDIGRIERLPRASTCFDPHSWTDFRVRRFAALILEQFGYMPQELAVQAEKPRLYRYPNVVRIGARYGAYSYDGLNRVQVVVTAKQFVAYGDTAEDAFLQYRVMRKHTDGRDY